MDRPSQVHPYAWGSLPVTRPLGIPRVLAMMRSHATRHSRLHLRELNGINTVDAYMPAGGPPLEAQGRAPQFLQPALQPFAYTIHMPSCYTCLGLVIYRVPRPRGGRY